MDLTRANRILESRRDLIAGAPSGLRSDEAGEGGCGVLGFAANILVSGRHVLNASHQMHNRGNGKGGGIAMVGMDPIQARVDRSTLRSHTLLQIALLEPTARPEIERSFIQPFFEIAQAYELPHMDDYRGVGTLDVRPPDVWRYFIRPKDSALDEFVTQNGLEALSTCEVADEFVYQNSFRINSQFYASLGEQRAFVLSHGRNLSVLKIVGYAEDVVEYYQLEEQRAHVWIAHQRYPTKGRVWHPGGAHPFIGLNEALVHNGDFANYHAVSEYLSQRNISQLFLTDTEVGVQLFDLWDRVYGYPLEITLEAMAPTSEFDFAMLPPEKKGLYQAVQRAHIHGSPDGPWFFILARSLGNDTNDHFELLGITDTSMLRPQVFALYENSAPLGSWRPEEEGVQIGLIASERQAINACLRSLSAEDPRFQPMADRYWVARGGSHTDGGAFRFIVTAEESNRKTGADPLSPVLRLQNENKFGAPVVFDSGRWHVDPRQLDPSRTPIEARRWWQVQATHAFDDGGAPTIYSWLKQRMPTLSWDELTWGLGWLGEFGAHGDEEWLFTLQAFNYLRDRHYHTGRKKATSVLRLVDQALLDLFSLVPILTPENLFDERDWRLEGLERIRRVNWENRGFLQEPVPGKITSEQVLLIDALEFPSEGDDAAARSIVNAYRQGWRHIIAFNWRGGRFAASGLGADSDGLRIDLYGDVGDYAASGLDGAEVHLHGAGQDQLGQILKRGKLVIHGDAGQTFLYGAKGGEIYVQGSVAGRPLINSVGRPRAVINGTCLDYLAESFMAGDPLHGGGFVILNGVGFDEKGKLLELESPYPGGNLFSLASGGAIYLRDPRRKVASDQLNGGKFDILSAEDWDLIEPYLQENARQFEIPVDALLTVDGVRRAPKDVYRKVSVHSTGVLTDTENR